MGLEVVAAYLGGCHCLSGGWGLTVIIMQVSVQIGLNWNLTELGKSTFMNPNADLPSLQKEVITSSAGSATLGDTS